jgi:hypothetical protein
MDEIAALVLRALAVLIVLAFSWGAGWAIVTVLDERLNGQLTRHATTRRALTGTLALAVLGGLWFAVA